MKSYGYAKKGVAQAQIVDLKGKIDHLEMICYVSAPRKARRIWSGGSPGMERVNHPPLPSVAPLAERCSG